MKIKMKQNRTEVESFCNEEYDKYISYYITYIYNYIFMKIKISMKKQKKHVLTI